MKVKYNIKFIKVYFKYIQVLNSRQKVFLNIGIKTRQTLLKYRYKYFRHNDIKGTSIEHVDSINH